MKVGRQAKIIELIGRYNIETQEELAEKLLGEGYEVTQATISRDIRALKLTKVAGPGGRQIYKLLPRNTDLERKYLNIFRDGFMSMDTAQNLLVIKTAVGMAMALAAVLDDLELPEVVGAIAGDDVIMVATRSSDDCIELMKKIRKIIDSDERQEK